MEISNKNSEKERLEFIKVIKNMQVLANLK